MKTTSTTSVKIHFPPVMHMYHCPSSEDPTLNGVIMLAKIIQQYADSMQLPPDFMTQYRMITRKNDSGETDIFFSNHANGENLPNHQLCRTCYDTGALFKEIFN